MRPQSGGNGRDEWQAPVGQMMSTVLVTVDADRTVSDAAVLMRERGVGCLVVPEESSGGVAGLFTERDLLMRVVGAGLDPSRTTVGQVMTRHVTVLEVDTPFAVASDLVNQQGFRHVPVVSGGRLAGMVSMRDLFRTRLRRMESQLEDEVRALHEAHSLLEMDDASRVRALLAVNQRLQELALTDELTGLYNHRYFLRRLTEEVNRCQRLAAPLSLLFADIDHFKRVNDAHGHPNGDLVLQHVAWLLRDAVEGSGVLARLRRSDVVTRYGGEEFAVLLMDARVEGARVVADRIRTAIAETPAVLAGALTIGVTVSIGVASIPESAADGDELVRVADQALYQAKHTGRNRVELAPGK